MTHPSTYQERMLPVDINELRHWLNRYSIDLLRISLGLVFALFGFLKFFPGASPAEDLAIRTVETLSFGIVSGSVALWTTAAVECFIGLTLVTGRFLKAGLVTLGFALVGILSPVVLFFGDLFPGAPTLEAQYVLKDLVLAAAGLVVGAAARAAGSRTADPSFGRGFFPFSGRSPSQNPAKLTHLEEGYEEAGVAPAQCLLVRVQTLDMSPTPVADCLHDGHQRLSIGRQ